MLICCLSARYAEAVGDRENDRRARIAVSEELRRDHENGIKNIAVIGRTGFILRERRPAYHCRRSRHIIQIREECNPSAG